MSDAAPLASEPLDGMPDAGNASAVVGEGLMSVGRRAASPGSPVWSAFVAATGETPEVGDFTLDGTADEAQPLGISELSPANAADDVPGAPGRLVAVGT